LLQLCDYFDVSADYLLGRSDTMALMMAQLTDEQTTCVMNVINQFAILNGSPI